MQKWEYLAVPLEEVKKLKKDSGGFPPSRLNELGAQGWEAVGLSLKYGDLVAWPRTTQAPLALTSVLTADGSRAHGAGEDERERSYRLRHEWR